AGSSCATSHRCPNALPLGTSYSTSLPLPPITGFTPQSFSWVSAASSRRQQPTCQPSCLETPARRYQNHFYIFRPPLHMVCSRKPSLSWFPCTSSARFTIFSFEKISYCDEYGSARAQQTSQPKDKR